MKLILILPFIILSLITSAQSTESLLLKTILADSVINKYMLSICEIEHNDFLLFHESGNYVFNKGVVEFKEHKCDDNSSFVRVGTIRKIKIKKEKAIVRIYFKGEDSFYAKTTLSRDAIKMPWTIKTRFLYRNFKIPRKKPQLLYYSIN